MGVYIMGREMPKAEFGSMIVAIRPDGMVEDVMGCYVGKAVPVPPHGRLIDADALKVQDGWLRDSKYFAQESSHTHITFVYSNDIYNAPTVIPADKDGET